MVAQERPNSEIFIELFTEIERELRKGYDERFYAGFTEMLRKLKQTNAVVRQYYSDLQEYAQLRNAIVHTRRENYVIAEPHIEVVKQIRLIRNMLKNPPRLSTVMTQKPFSAAPKDTMRSILAAFAERGIMRCPVVDKGTISGLITAKTIARWLTANQSPVLNLDSQRVADLMPFMEKADYVVVSESTDVFTLAGMFKNSVSQGRYIQAALITSNGKDDSPLVGIITPADVPFMVEGR